MEDGFYFSRDMFTAKTKNFYSQIFPLDKYLKSDTFETNKKQKIDQQITEERAKTYKKSKPMLSWCMFSEQFLYE